MKKIIFVLAAVLACSFAIAACSYDKKSRKSMNAVTIEVTPSSINHITASSNTYVLTAQVYNKGILQPDTAVSWTVNPSNFGACVPVNGVSTVFTADTSMTGQGTIIASYNGTDSSSVQFSINEDLPDSTPSIRFLFKDNLNDPNIKWAFDVFGDWQWYPSGYVDSRTPQYPTTSDLLVEGAAAGISGIDEDPLSVVRITFKKGTWSSDNYAGMTFGFINNENLSSYTKIYFHLKGENGGEKVVIRPINPNNNIDGEEAITVNSAWTPYMRPFSGTSDQAAVFNVFFKESDGSADGSKVYVDYIYLEK
ncbi:MAG: hypothetical protein FWH43_06270 [Endomicrobia bacterium]|nr:hypothetical protein [Endomicrobiia bacterium]